MALGLVRFVFCGLFAIFFGFFPANARGERPIQGSQTPRGAVLEPSLFFRTAGDPRNQAIVFVHGGPGFDSYDFEATTAAPLAQLGYYVVTYDQQGQGRSPTAALTAFAYRAYADDLMNLVSRLRLNRPILIGHSHGGPIAIHFDVFHPGVARAVILASAPVDFWRAIQDMKSTCEARYAAAGRGELLSDLRASFATLAATRIGSESLVEPTARLFQHALFGCRLYSTRAPSEDEKRVRALVTDPPAPRMEPMPGFLVNESYLYRDHSRQVAKEKGRYFGVYGDEDGLFSARTRAWIQSLLNEPNETRFFLIKGASHAVYLDQQRRFLDLVDAISKRAPR